LGGSTSSEQDAYEPPFHAVQNPAIRVVAGEKVTSRLLHPDVIAHTDATNAGNKRSFSVAKTDDANLTHQKKAA
jgi:hypothetical protein